MRALPVPILNNCYTEHENDNDDSYDDNSDSDCCCTSDDTENNNNTFDEGNSGTHTAKHYDDQFALLNSAICNVM